MPETYLCAAYAEHGACFCSTGVLGDCPVDDSDIEDGDEFDGPIVVTRAGGCVSNSDTKQVIAVIGVCTMSRLEHPQRPGYDVQVRCSQCGWVDHWPDGTEARLRAFSHDQRHHVDAVTALRTIVRYYEPGKPTTLRVGTYVGDPCQPAAIGWCEAIVTPYNGEVGRHCNTYARFDRDGRRVCGLHAPAHHVTYGPER